jgi:predicted RNA-binding Zn-ribbon protein involved in translation (DUF1610 family)
MAALATTSAHKPGFFIGVSCPGCGGELELGSNFFVLTCPHCASVLRLVMPDAPPAFLVRSRKQQSELRFLVDRFCRENRLPLTSASLQIKPLYYPYWKVDAVLLKVRTTTYEVERDDDEQYSRYADEQAEERTHTDINLAPYMVTLPAGYTDESIPFSLGVRVDYVRMIPFATENVDTDFDCPPVTVTWHEALAGLEKTVSKLNRLGESTVGLNGTQLFRPHGSIIYFPYYVVDSYSAHGAMRFVVDGISGKVAGSSSSFVRDKSASPDQTPCVDLGRLEIELHRCANCGEDLPETQSFLYYCRNCRHIQTLEQSSLLASEALMAVASAASGIDRYFPFWILRVSDEDCARIKPMIGGIYSSDRFAVPAFEIRNFEAMFRLTKRMSSAFPQLTRTPLTELSGNFEAVTVGLSDALTLAEVVLGREQTSRTMRLPHERFDFRPLEAQVCFVPFHPERYFMVDSILGAVTFEKSLADTVER